ncbi:unnamed protein product [Rotaria socialis]
MTNVLKRSINYDDHRRHKRTGFSLSNRTTNRTDLSIKNYFLKVNCIKANFIQKAFRFNEQSGQIDRSSKFRLIVSLDALDSFTNQYKGKVYSTFSLYFHLSCAVIYIFFCVTLVTKTLIPKLVARFFNIVRSE